MATDQEIAEGLDALFRESNPNSFNSLNDVVLRLQSKLGGHDLSHKLDFIRAQISLIFNSIPRPIVNPNPQNPNPSPNPNPSNQNQPSHPQIQHPQIHPNQQYVYRQHHPGAPAAVSHFPASFGGGGGGGGPRGPTEISFAQPGGSVVGADLNSSGPVKESTQSRPKRRGGPGGLNKLCGVSPLLQAIVGQPAMPRTEIVKQLWAYIRKHNLQDPSNKRKIICNDELRLVFEVDSTDMFQMNKLLAKHILPLDPAKESEQKAKKLKVEEPQAPNAETGSDPSPILISEALAKFFGTDEKEMLQSEVYKRVEEYIKAEGLEDPLNSSVLCDTKLQELFGCESIPAPEIREVLARNHLFQRA